MLRGVFGELAGRARYSAAAVSVRMAVSLLAVGPTFGCAAVYPEIATPVKPVPPGRELMPPPPTDVLYIAIRQVEIPPRTRDGRRWDELGKGAPDPYAKIFLNDHELFVTSTQSDTFKPTWPDAPKQNYRVDKEATLMMEIWDDNALHSQPICSKVFKNLHEEALQNGELRGMCDGGSRIRIDLKPAQAKFGLGLFYELRTESVVVTRTLPLSPASRAGLAGGEEIVEVMGRPVRKMNSAELRSAINANAPQGVTLKIRHGDVFKDVLIQEGPIYDQDSL